MKRIIGRKQSVIVAADVPDIHIVANLAEAMAEVSGISAFKTGFVALRGLKRVVSVIKDRLGREFPVIHDHQKAGNDIPEVGKKYVHELKIAGVDAAILFPFAGPATQEAWTKACQDVGLEVLTGGIMTHPKFLVSEGGYIADEAVERIFRFACLLGVKHFVVPGNKIHWVRRIRSWLIEELGEGNFVLYAPGFITQGGDISECGEAAGNEWHAIVGSAIYGQASGEAQRQAAVAVTRQIVS